MGSEGPAHTRAAVPGLRLAWRSVSGPVWALLLSVLLAVAVLAAVLVHRETLRRLALSVQHDNAQLAEQVDRSHGELTGAMLVLGLVDPRIKAVLAGTAAPDDELHQSFATVIRRYRLDNMQLVDRQGVTVAYLDDEGTNDSVGSDRSARPFVARSLAGLTSRDPMIGRSSGVRGIYVAAPVRARVSEQAPVLGIVVVRTGLEAVDRVLGQASDPAVLLSPDGLVYATNRPDWLFKLSEPLSDEREQALRQSQQFGKLLASGRPATLPFSFSPGVAQLDGRHYTMAEQALDWQLEGRGWRLLLLRERSFVAEWGPAATLAGVVLLTGAATCLLWLRRQGRRLAVEQERAQRDADLRAVTEAAYARLLRMSESLPCAVFQFLQPDTGPGRLLFVGQPVQEILGLAAERLLADGAAHLRQVHPQDWRALARALVRARCTQAPLAIDYRLRIGDAERWVRMAARAARQGGEGFVWTGYWLDVSAEVATRSDLQQREEQLRQLLESAPGAVIVSSEDGRMLFHNRRALEQHGRAPSDVATLYADPGQRAALIEALRRDGVAQHDAVQLLRQDGSTFRAQITMSRGQFAQHRSAVFGWAEDVTERWQAAQALREAKEAAESAAATKSAFLANMSHEIRTPMNAIIGLAHLALQTRLSAQQRDYIQKVHKAARALLGIVNDILDFSKIEAGKLAIEPSDFVLDDVLADLATLSGEKAAEQGLELVFEVDADVPAQLRSDALRLGQVLTNLVSNALKFTERGEVVLHCALAAAPQGGMALAFTVSDTGIGMSAAQVARIFSPFSQADESTTRRFGGTGLGLSISKRLVEAAGGTLALDSTPGQGSRFRFLWPCTPASLPVPRPALPAPLQGARALVVSAHPRVAAALAGQLRRAGCRAYDAGSGQDALHRCASTTYGVVLCDQHLPDMSDLDLLQALAQRAGGPSARVLVAARADEPLRAQARLTGATAVLSKPVIQAVLVRALRAEDDAEDDVDAQAAVPRLDGLRVLLVEDNPINQQVALELMRAAGVQVDVAANGRLALDVLHNGPDAYDLVLMDLQMPVMDGHEATRHIRANARLAALPIVAMTAHAMVDERERCLAEGMNDHLSKPIDPPLLYRVLARWGLGQVLEALPVLGPPAAPQPPADDWTVRLAAALPGLDVAAALRRVRGDRGLYGTLLQRFVQEQGDFASRFAALLQAQDIGGAARAAHTFKGVAATLGLVPLAALATTLERALASAMPQACDNALDAVHDAVRQVLQALQAHLPLPLDSTAAQPPPDPGHALRRLLEMLEAMDGEAGAQLDALSPWLAGRLDPADWTALQSAVRRYDFDDALGVLRGAPALAAYGAPA